MAILVFLTSVLLMWLARDLWRFIHIDTDRRPK